MVQSFLIACLQFMHPYMTPIVINTAAFNLAVTKNWQYTTSNVDDRDLTISYV